MPEQIISKENPKIKLLKKLSQKKYRQEFGLFKVENLKTIFDGLKNGVKPEMIFVDEIKIPLIPPLKRGDFTHPSIPSQKGTYLINDIINKYISDLDTPSGICAVYKIKDKKLDWNKPIVYLNGINDPGNLGTILRTALAFGFVNIVCDEKCADIYNPKTIQAAKNAIFYLNIVEDKNLIILKEAKKKNFEIVATSLSAKSINYNKWKPKNNWLMIFGSEAHGIDKSILKLANIQIKIPISPKIESLNVNSSAAIILNNLGK